MWGYLFSTFIALALCIYSVVWPVIVYFKDPKKLRQYPNLNTIAGITDLGFIWESHQGFRSKTLLELHKKHPVVRIGPNSLSYGGVKAIKVSRQTFCLCLCLVIPTMLTLSRTFMVTLPSASKTTSTQLSLARTIIWRTSSINRSMHESVKYYLLRMP